MSDKEKLDIACMQLRIAIKKNCVPSNDIAKKWAMMACTSTQKRNALARQSLRF